MRAQINPKVQGLSESEADVFCLILRYQKMSLENLISLTAWDHISLMAILGSLEAKGYIRSEGQYEAQKWYPIGVVQ